MLKKLLRGGAGYCITVENGKEVFNKSKDIELPYEIEHIYPDYEIYYGKVDNIENTAYGFLTRGCPRNCDFCIVGKKEGLCSVKVADLNEFWSGQKNIILLDPNITACRDCEELFEQLIKSNATVEFNQGLDIRIMTEEKARLIKQMKIQNLHFAFDKYEEKDIVIPKLEMFSRIYEKTRSKCVVYVLANFNTTIEQDLERIYTIRDLGFTPYVMLYQKEQIPKGHKLRKMERWVNNKFVFRSCDRFEDYNRKEQIEIKGQQTLF